MVLIKIFKLKLFYNYLPEKAFYFRFPLVLEDIYFKPSIFSNKNLLTDEYFKICNSWHL